MPCSAPPALRPLKSCDVITLRHGSQAGSHDAVDLCAPQRPDEIERQVLERSSRAAPCDAQAAGDCPQAGEYLGGAVVGDDQPDADADQNPCHSQGHPEPQGQRPGDLGRAGQCAARGGHVVAHLQQVGGHFLAGKDRPPRLAATVQHTRGVVDGGGISRRETG